ncbi:MAG: sulfate ABC transporter permease subunit CysW [Candidatus Hydrogenedentes bacterium]|nr:sulfate ABC transporter permease subunit CysW [Candidatus Hydrogenedentota bacterium]
MLSLKKNRAANAASQPRLVRRILIGSTVLFLGLFLLLPLIAVFAYALEQGGTAYWMAIKQPEALAALRLTLMTVAVAAPLNALFGIAAAWAIAKFEFRGKNILITLIDLPFTVSPVIAGAMFVLLFGARSAMGGWLLDRGIQIIFAPPGIFIATIFVTFPLVARELIPLMQALGNDDEEAAVSLGAGPLQTFWRITLPNIRWGLLYGVVLCVARAMGEFGAVSVVSGHIRGVTNTMPLQIEILYNEYDYVAAFSVASLLALVSLVTLGGKKIFEWKSRQHIIDQSAYSAQGGPVESTAS